MTPQATGAPDPADPRWVVLARRFRAPIEDVWAAVTEPERLARWIGTWEGDPSSGRVSFTMTAEGEDVPAVDYLIESCTPPRRLVVVAPGPEGESWRLRLEVSGEGGEAADGPYAVFTLAQELTDPELAASVGPGWDYYLDRLVAAETGGDVDAISFDDYYPALGEHYRGLAHRLVES